MEDADYHTNDKDDAIASSQAAVRQMTANWQARFA